MFYKYNYKISVSDEEETNLVSSSDQSPIHYNELEDYEIMETNIEIQNKIDKHEYFWMKDLNNNLNLFSEIKSIDFIKEIFNSTSTENQVYEYTVKDGLLFILENIGHTEKFAKEYAQKHFSKKYFCVIQLKDQQKNGYIILSYKDQNKREVDDTEFLLVVSNKIYAFQNFELLLFS
jgi:hypothetical protein